MIPTKRATEALLIGTLVLGAFSIAGNALVGEAQAQSGTTFWMSGRSLIAGTRGVYPHGGQLGETPSLLEGSVSFFPVGRPRVLTWVKEFATSATYYVWQRQFADLGSIDVAIDDKPVTGGTRHETFTQPRYVWVEVGAMTIAQGQHHVDVTAHGYTILDAVLLTTDRAFLPYTTTPPFTVPAMLPPPDTSPVLRARRTYRDDSALGSLSESRGFIVARLPALYGEPYDVPNDDFVPAADQILSKIELWSAKNQYPGTTFAVRALGNVAPLVVTASALSGPRGRTLGADKIDLKVAKVIPRTLELYDDFRLQQLWPEFLLRDDRTTLPIPQGRQGGFGGGTCTSGLGAHESRQFWLTIHVPLSTPTGLYSGTLTFKPGGGSPRFVLPLVLDVKPISLQPVQGAYGMFYPFYPFTADPAGTLPPNQHHISARRYRSELADMVRHGLNSTTLYEGFDQLRFVSSAGMRGHPLQMGWPPVNAQELVDQAREEGFAGYPFWTCDEAAGGAIGRCKQSILGYTDTYYHELAGTLNNVDAAAALADLLHYPIFDLAVFSGPDNSAATRSQSLGHLPSSYFSTATSDFLAYRAWGGLYNIRCGFEGVWWWAYNDFANDEVAYDWAHLRTNHVVAYPDVNEEPISTIRWEAYKDGIDDIRYLQELDRLIGKARTWLGKNPPLPPLQAAIDDALSSRAREYESIANGWIGYLGLLPADQLDISRRALADAIMGLNAPYAANMSVTTTQDVPVTGTLAGTELDGKLLMYVVLSSGRRGRVDVTDYTSGAFTYRPARGAVGTDSFTYKVLSDGIESNVGVVSVTINR